jgi:uncharacterized membrane protein (DUF485 family)
MLADAGVETMAVVVRRASTQVAMVLQGPSTHDVRHCHTRARVPDRARIGRAMAPANVPVETKESSPMLHEPASPSGKDPAAAYKSRLGVQMFAFYTVFYAGFVAINLLSPLTMATIVIAGLNLATVYGMALIVLALVQALVYNRKCSRKEQELARLEASKSDVDATPSSGS